MLKIGNRIINTINELKLTPYIRSGLMVNMLLDLRKKETLTRIGLDWLQDYEKKYVNSLETFIENKYKISIKRVEGGDTQEINKLDNLHSSSLINLLLSFQSVFEVIKKSLSINSVEDLSVFRKIINILTYPLTDEDISYNDFIDFISEVPYSLWSKLENNNLISSFFYINIDKEFQIKKYSDMENYGFTIYSNKGNSKKYSYFNCLNQ